jgi:hypothetical protein
MDIDKEIKALAKDESDLIAKPTRHFQHESYDDGQKDQDPMTKLQFTFGHLAQKKS